mmetsp:Transcript_2205/g.5458  ORF Transcript_2205/g.5458 Transcript_2205/m.5458 type:complete len:318 (+) Transcript_2205:65-1018(+)
MIRNVVTFVTTQDNGRRLGKQTGHPVGAKPIMSRPPLAPSSSNTCHVYSCVRVARDLVHTLGGHACKPTLGNVVCIDDQRRERVAVATTSVETGRVRATLQLPARIVAENHPLRTVPGLCPRRAAILGALEADPLRGAAVRRRSASLLQLKRNVRAHARSDNVADKKQVLEPLFLQGNARHHPGVDDDEAQPGEAKGQRQFLQPQHVRRRHLKQCVVLVRLQAASKAPDPVPGLQQLIVVVSPHCERTELSAEPQHLVAARTLVHQVADEHQCVAPWLEGRGAKQCAQLRRAAMDVSDEDDLPARAAANVMSVEALV